MAYHSFGHAAELLMILGAMGAAAPRGGPLPTLARAGLFLPSVALPFSVALTGSLTGEALCIVALQVLVLGTLVEYELRARGGCAPASAAPTTADRRIPGR